MKKVTVRRFARKQRQIVNGGKVHQSPAVTRHAKDQVSKTGPASHHRLRARELLQALTELPMTEAEGNQILKDFAGEAVF
ncbi:MAG: hypothetical protein HY735_38280 [Verrucomicrobia bacterium]|nr:hypothetical protein [Verrucomicrobiota bacterium]